MKRPLERQREHIQTLKRMIALTHKKTQLLEKMRVQLELELRANELGIEYEDIDRVTTQEAMIQMERQGGKFRHHPKSIPLNSYIGALLKSHETIVFKHPVHKKMRPEDIEAELDADQNSSGQEPTAKITAMNTESPEQVLVLPKSTLQKICPLPFNVNVAEAKPIIEKAASFQLRAEMEKNAEFKQIIPYVLIQHEDRYLCVQRTNKQTESRLHDQYALGVGGHINPVDAEQKNLLEAGMRRELNEETQREQELSCELVGIINTNTTEVDTVHTGFVYLLKVGSGNVRVGAGEEDHHRQSWKTKEELQAMEPSLESWAKIVLHNIIEK